MKPDTTRSPRIGGITVPDRRSDALRSYAPDHELESGHSHRPPLGETLSETLSDRLRVAEEGGSNGAAAGRL